VSFSAIQSLNMSLTLRQRLLLIFLPLVTLLALLGAAGSFLLHRLGGSIDEILRENYDSVVAMQDLKEALERIDSSFQFMLVARDMRDPSERQQLEDKAKIQFTHNWSRFEEALRTEQKNVTIYPDEETLVADLTAVSETYRRQGKDFFDRARQDGVRNADYYGKTKLYETFLQIKGIAGQILDLNQNEMRRASQRASDTASNSLLWFGTGLVLGAVLLGLLALHTARAILRPIRTITRSAMEISAGNLDQVVPTMADDELGKLAQAFNAMAHSLRDYRQSQSAQLIRAQRTSQATIDSFPDAVLVIDNEGQVEMANPAARHLLGVLPRQPGQAGTGMWTAPEPLRQPLSEALRGQQNHLPESFDKALLLGASGAERAVLPRILTIRDPYGATLGAAIVLQDVTRLRLLDQVKSNLVATASHELKTPLTSVRLAVHLLLEETIGPVNPKQMELLLDARENSERLLAMINNLLDLARLEQGYQQLDMQPESPEALLRTAAEAIAPRAQDKRVDVTLDVPPGLPSVAVDQARMGTALRNLLDNALTYTDPGGQITLSAAANGDDVILTVTDTGTGIPPEHLPHIFEKFSRVPGQSRGSGTGLGLAIVHEIVTAHGGTITCESQPGTGTTFRMTLPVAPRESGPR
jgi:signal transduction histidine kinase